MSNPLISITDCSTGEETIREMTDQEYAQSLIDKETEDASIVEEAAKQAEIDAAKAAVHEKLSELGITPELIEVIKKL